MERKAYDTVRSKEATTYLDHLVTIIDSQQEIRDQLVTFLLAAKDTTAALLSSAVHQLALHPEVVGKLQKEIRSLDKDAGLTYDTIKGLWYLRAFINETLR